MCSLYLNICIISTEKIPLFVEKAVSEISSIGVRKLFTNWMNDLMHHMLLAHS